jgi:flagellar basal-body rod modification protein FlgD
MSAIAPTSSTTGTSTTASGDSIVNNQEIASNFTTFLQLLTTQLQNQDPLSPMDTNQFTQQLVEFAQVEQQMQSNTQLSTLVSLQQTAQSSAALSYVGATVVVDGSTAQMTNSAATWNLNVSKPAAATVTITDSTGQTVYSGTMAVQPGTEQFVWNGLSNSGQQLPDGTYKLTATAVDASNQSTPVTTTIQGKVDSADLTQNPPTLSINGQDFALNQIKQILSAN